jgi:hypothetical protein
MSVYRIRMFHPGQRRESSRRDGSGDRKPKEVPTKSRGAETKPDCHCH